jgi:predicted Zn-dependent protease
MKQGIRISTLGPITPLPGLDAPFVAPFTGRWVHNGSPGAALAGGYLAGTLKEILGEVEAAGSDLVFTPRRGSFGSPSLLLSRAPVRSA